MANEQLTYYENKVKKLMDKIPCSQRNPHRFLDSALDTWEHKDKHPVFVFLISAMSNYTVAGYEGLDATAIKLAPK